MKPVEVVVDLRDFRQPPQAPAEFKQFWERLQQGMVGKQLQLQTCYEISHQSQGVLRLTVIALPPEHAIISAQTPFAVHSLLEPPQIRHQCVQCQANRRQTYGAYFCDECGRNGKPGRVCEEHVVILLNGIRHNGHLLSSCNQHIPRCQASQCQSQAVFWCRGPNCVRKHHAWCEKHRRQHPNDRETSYCSDCYAELFPACDVDSCRNTATSICEHVDEETQQICGRRLCSRHTVRWQIYGPHKEGLGRCSNHRSIRDLRDDQLIYQMVAGTAKRKQKHREDRQNLPSLQSVRHILLKVRRQSYDLRTINQMFESLASRLRQRNDFEKMMGRLLEWHTQTRDKNLLRDEGEKEIGRQVFERVKQEYIRRNLVEVAAALVFSDYKPIRIQSDAKQPGKLQFPLLFVRLDSVWRGRFFGRGGATIKEIGELLNVKINIEGDR